MSIGFIIVSKCKVLILINNLSNILQPIKAVITCEKKCFANSQLKNGLVTTFLQAFILRTKLCFQVGSFDL